MENGLTKVFCILGATGVGKSSLANSLCGHPDLFKTSADLKSETTEVTGVLVQMKKQGILGTKCNVLVLDTPGQGDSEGRD